MKVSIAGWAAVALMVAGCSTQRPASDDASSPAVQTGLEAFLASPPEIVKGKRIGLVTNQSGLTATGERNIDAIGKIPGVKITAIFSPEHGISGTMRGGVQSSVDEKTGIPITSLFGKITKPTPEMLKDVDVLVYDIQDIGVRQYTFESTMALTMQAAAEKGIPYIVLDRPNPITGNIVEGNLTDTAYLSFVGIYPVASRHGMTVGELAKMYNDVYKIGADLTVIPMKGWKRGMWWDETGIAWINPSPNIRRVEAEVIYPGSVFFEGGNISEGRGTPLPLEQVGASWLDNQKVASAMNAMKLPGVHFEPVDIQVDSTSRKYRNETIKGIRFDVTDRETFRPIRSALLLFNEIKKTHPDKFEWGRGRHFDQLAGGAELRNALDSGTVAALLDKWDAQAAEFKKMRAPYLIYGDDGTVTTAAAR
jgi:uncharacterized protein YbbC (DUF1343 family)